MTVRWPKATNHQWHTATFSPVHSHLFGGEAMSCHDFQHFIRDRNEAVRYGFLDQDPGTVFRQVFIALEPIGPELVAFGNPWVGQDLPANQHGDTVEHDDEVAFLDLDTGLDQTATKTIRHIGGMYRANFFRLWPSCKAFFHLILLGKGGQSGSQFSGSVQVGEGQLGGHRVLLKKTVTKMCFWLPWGCRYVLCL